MEWQKGSVLGDWGQLTHLYNWLKQINLFWEYNILCYVFENFQIHCNYITLEIDQKISVVMAFVIL